MVHGMQVDCDIVNAHFDARVASFAEQVLAWPHTLDSDILGSANHSQVAAAMLAPHIGEKIHFYFWMIGMPNPKPQSESARKTESSEQ